MAENKILIDMEHIEKVVEFAALTKTMNEHMIQLTSSCAATAPYLGEKEHQILMDKALDTMNMVKFLHEIAQLVMEQASVELVSKIISHENRDSDSRDSECS